jgi:hypothetical protein
MRFAKWVFTCAGIWGLLVVPPLFFLFDKISAKVRRRLRTRSSIMGSPPSRRHGRLPSW